MEHGNKRNTENTPGETGANPKRDPVTLDALDQHVLARRARQATKGAKTARRGPRMKWSPERRRIEVYRLVGEDRTTAPKEGFQYDQEAVCWWTRSTEAALRMFMHFNGRIEVDDNMTEILYRETKG